MRSTSICILRIAPELFLKRCVVGGIEKVFEINRNFRNEGADSTHSPEFAMLETYEAYGTYDDSATMTRELIQEVAQEAFGTQRRDARRRHRIRPRWRMEDRSRCTRRCREAIGVEVTPETTVEELLALAEQVGLEIPEDKGYGHGKLVEELWEHQCGDQLLRADVRARFPGRDFTADPSASQQVRVSPRSGTSTSAASSWRRAIRNWSTR